MRHISSTAARVAIAGGGIGGMALALSLHAAGFRDVDVYESTGAVKELGVGINVQPHATRELTELGLLDALYAEAIPTAELTYYSGHGQRIWERAARDRRGLSLAAVSIELVDRASGAGRGAVEADILIGCDGVHSAVRRVLFPAEGPPRWNGITLWRGVTEAAPFLGGHTMIMAGPPNRQVVVYPISRRHEADGTALINWVAALKNAPDQPMPTQNWQHTARVEDVLPPFTSFVFDFLDVPALIRGAETIYRYPMVDRDPLPTWRFGRVTLLGDAAHPLYPVGGNGASQAIIDARVLARELARRPSIEEAIAAYDAERRPQTADVVLANRRGGPERCLAIVDERAPDGFTDRGHRGRLQADGRVRPGQPQQPRVVQRPAARLGESRRPHRAGGAVMNMCDYALEIAVRDRLAELRADAERWGRFEVGRSALPRLRDVVGRALVRMGSCMRRPGHDRLPRVRA